MRRAYGAARAGIYYRLAFFLIAAEELGVEPMLDLRMRLGEGSGCPLAMLLADHACRVLNEMATFDEAGIDDGYLDAIRDTERKSE